MDRKISTMIILYYGGQKSGKSKLAEKKARKIAKKNNQKPYYIATYDDSYFDEEMKERVKTHKQQRKDYFHTIEEPRDLAKVIKKGETYLVDCLSMWILNHIEDDSKLLFKQLKQLKKSKANIIFVLNNVNNGIIPLGKQSRKFVDYTGIIGQKVAKMSDKIYEVTLGVANKIK